MKAELNDLLDSLVSLALLPRPSERTQLEFVDSVASKFEELLSPEIGASRAPEISASLGTVVREALRPFLSTRAASSDELFALGAAGLRRLASELHVSDFDVPMVLPSVGCERGESIGRHHAHASAHGHDGRDKGEVIAELREQLRLSLRSEAALRTENARLRELNRADRALNDELARKLEVLAVLNSEPTEGVGLASIGYAGSGLPGSQSPSGNGSISPSASFNRHIPIVISAGAHPAAPRAERAPSRSSSMNNAGQKPRLAPPLSPAGTSDHEHDIRHERSSSECEGGDEAHAAKPKPVLRRLSSGAVRLEPPPPELDPEVNQRLSARTQSEEDEEEAGGASGQRGSKRRELAAALLSAKLPSGRRTTELVVAVDSAESPAGHQSADEGGSMRRRAHNDALRLAVAEGLRAGFSAQPAAPRAEGPPSPRARIESLSPPGSSRAARARQPASPRAGGGGESPTADSLRRIEERLASRRAGESSPPVDGSRRGSGAGVPSADSPTNAQAPGAPGSRPSEVFRVPAPRPQPLNAPAGSPDAQGSGPPLNVGASLHD
eukprot:tig00021017_g17178.t1